LTCFVDTSAFYALLDADDANHEAARKRWASLLDERAELVTSNYALVEVMALLQSRLGIAAARAFHEDVLPLLAVEWIGPDVHASGAAAMLSSGRKGLSLVDCTSFELMRNRGVKKAFAFDRHFKEQGFI
jgi:predicted nucleic acid-binding protein